MCTVHILYIDHLYVSFDYGWSGTIQLGDMLAPLFTFRNIQIRNKTKNLKIDKQKKG